MTRQYHILDPRLKWAHQHILQLERRINRFIESDPCNIIIEQNRDPSGNLLIRVSTEIRRQVPPELGLTLADAIHNLRSVVENAIWLLGRKFGASESIFCPVAKTESAFPLHPSYSGRNKTIIEDLLKFPHEVRTIIEDVQPFKAQDRGQMPEYAPLWILNRLWNDDKHRVPTLTALTQNVDIIYAEDAPSYPVVSLGKYVGLTHQGDFIVSEFSRIGRDMVPETTLDLKPRLEVVFADDGPGKSLPVILVMGGIYRFVREDILEKLKPFF